MCFSHFITFLIFLLLFLFILVISLQLISVSSQINSSNFHFLSLHFSSNFILIYFTKMTFNSFPDLHFMSILQINLLKTAVNHKIYWHPKVLV